MFEGGSHVSPSPHSRESFSHTAVSFGYSYDVEWNPFARPVLHLFQHSAVGVGGGGAGLDAVCERCFC